MQFKIIQRLTAYVGPWQLLMYALLYFFQNLHKGISGIKERTFATWFFNLGHGMAKFEEETPVPRLVGLASGVTLELGPAIGNQIPRFDCKAATHIYGIEPNKDLFAVLKGRVVGDKELQTVYTPILGALEDDALLQEYGIVPGSLDSVVSIQVLCSVEDAREAARRIHRLLKPGGRFLFWEHRASTDGLTRVMQSLWGLLWSPLIGGCQLMRNVEDAIMSAGPWKVEELRNDESVPYSLLPRTWGYLIKLDE